jgi:hypothetical protein
MSSQMLPNMESQLLIFQVETVEWNIEQLTCVAIMVALTSLL